MNPMQEQIQENTENQARRKLPKALAAAIVIIGVLGLGGLGTAYALLHNHYMGYISQLQAIVNDNTQKFQNGDPNAGASLTDQYNYYAVLNGDIGNLTVLLDTVNNQYPLLPFKETPRSLGIADLQQKMNAMAAQLATLRDCIGTDGTVAADLTSLLDKSSTADVSADMATLASRNDALDAQVSAISFTGTIESKRAEFALGIQKRGAALHYLAEDSAVQSELAALLTGPLPSVQDAVSKFNALNDRNEALAGKYAGIDLTGISAKPIDFGAAVAARREQLKAATAYVQELEPLIGSVAQFCNTLSAPVQGATFGERLASYMVRVDGLQALEDRLKAINDKPAYASLPARRSIADLGFTGDGQTLLGYRDTVGALGNGVKKSDEMEKKIDSLLKNTKMTLPDKVSTLNDLLDQNTAILNGLQSGVPADLTQGLAGFQAGCQERAVFIGYFLDYVQDKVLADGHMTLYKSYLATKASYLESANYYTLKGLSDMAKHYKQLANDQGSLAAAEKAAYNDCLKQENTDKAAYTASRTKYKAMLAGD